MTDLIDDEAMEQFAEAMRDVTDTFHRYAVTVELSGGTTYDLVAGIKEITGELQAGEGGDEIDRAFRLRLGRAYLAEQGLVDGTGMLLIDYDTIVTIDGQRYTMAKLQEPVVFRDRKLVVMLEVVR